MRRIVIAIVLLLVVGRAAGGEAFNYPEPAREGKAGVFSIAENGVARCVIVFPAKRSLTESRFAAPLLKAYLELATGATFVVQEEGKPVPEGMGVIHVGETAAAGKVELGIPELRYGDDVIPNLNGYLVRTVDEHTLVIRGVTDRATALGVAGFLKRYVGVRHYWEGNPGDIGDVVPKQATLALPEVEWRDWPYFASRQMSGVASMGPLPDGAYKDVKSTNLLRLNYTIPSNESYYRWLPVSKFGESHPEYFPLFGGKRHVPVVPTEGPEKGRVPQGWQPCVSNPEVVRVMAEALIEHFDKNPNDIAINLAVNDGNGDCECAACQAIDAPGADRATRNGLCDRYVKFSNQVCEIVGKKYPGKIIAFIAYGSMRRPPTTVRLHPMLMPVLTMGANVNAFAQWDAWEQMGARRMGMYLYHDDQPFFLMPKMDVHQSAKRIRYAAASGHARHFYQEVYPYWPIDGMVVHVQNELLWDPRQDVDAILAEYYTKFFGPAAQPMQGFYETLEAGYTRWLEAEGIAHPYGKDRGSLSDGRTFEQFKVLNAAEATRAEASLAEAVEAAKGDAVVSQRVDIVKRLFGFIALGAKQYTLMEELGGAKVTSEAEAELTLRRAREAVALARAQGKYKVEVCEQPPSNLYAIYSTTRKDEPKRNVLFAEIGPDKVHPALVRAVGEGLGAASAYLSKSIGAEAAVAWWDRQIKDEPDSLMKEAMGIARAKARGVPLVNLMKDGGFEMRGAGVSPRTGKAIEKGQEDRDGLRIFHRNGTPFKYAVVQDEVHGGKYAVMFEECGWTVLSDGVPTPGGGQFHLEAWVKHNEAEANYALEAVAIAPGNNQRIMKVGVPWRPGEWQKVEMDYPVPAGTTYLTLRLTLNGQTTGARVWTDDFFIGKYPE